MNQETPWNDEATKTLRDLWPSHSAAQIARLLGNGFTRNSVMGKAHRMGLLNKGIKVSGSQTRERKKD